MDRCILWLALVSLIALSPPAPVQAGCGTATCPLDLSTVHLHPLRLQIAFEYIAQDRLRAGTDKVTFGQLTRPDHEEIETNNRNMLLRLDSNVTERFSTTLSLPIVQRRHSHIALPATTTASTSIGCSTQADIIRLTNALICWDSLSAHLPTTTRPAPPVNTPTRPAAPGSTSAQACATGSAG